ncbi:MAG: NAD-dependent epimerase/dehydratase family protein [Verrucomicrobia bacterium]|nr:NAD-dependent epimerase/dehydratase family protein [Verrucomicrobiota bacterium]
MAHDSSMDFFWGKRLVIFGCGYVGAAVAREVLTRGARVTALTRNEAIASVLRQEGIDTVVADLATDVWHERVAGSPDFSLNCVSSGGGGVDGYRHSYVGGMASIVAWARRQGPVGTLVYTSSTSVYPQGDGAVVDESAPTDLAEERGQLLLEAETRLRGGTGSCGRWFVLRLAGIYGPGRHHLVDQVRGGEVSGVGSQRLNLIHRDDIVAAILACFGAPSTVANEIFNVADDGAATKADVALWLAARLGVPAPGFSGAPAEARRSVTPDRIIANAKLKARLGWRPGHPTFREGYANLGSR